MTARQIRNLTIVWKIHICQKRHVAEQGAHYIDAFLSRRRRCQICIRKYLFLLLFVFTLAPRIRSAHYSITVQLFLIRKHPWNKFAQMSVASSTKCAKRAQQLKRNKMITVEPFFFFCSLKCECCLVFVCC